MGALQQILLGTGLLTLSALVHVAAIAISIPFFGKLSAQVPKSTSPRLSVVVLLAFTVFVLVSAHTLQVWTWAVTFLMIIQVFFFDPHWDRW